VAYADSLVYRCKW